MVVICQIECFVLPGERGQLDAWRAELDGRCRARLDWLERIRANIEYIAAGAL